MGLRRPLFRRTVVWAGTLLLKRPAKWLPRADGPCQRNLPSSCFKERIDLRWRRTGKLGRRSDSVGETPRQRLAMADHSRLSVSNRHRHRLCPSGAEPDPYAIGWCDPRWIYLGSDASRTEIASGMPDGLAVKLLSDAGLLVPGGEQRSYQYRLPRCVDPDRARGLSPRPAEDRGRIVRKALHPGGQTFIVVVSEPPQTGSPASFGIGIKPVICSQPPKRDGIWLCPFQAFPRVAGLTG